MSALQNPRSGLSQGLTGVLINNISTYINCLSMEMKTLIAWGLAGYLLQMNIKFDHLRGF